MTVAADPGAWSRGNLDRCDDYELVHKVQLLPRASAEREAACEVLIVRYQPLVRSCALRYREAPGDDRGADAGRVCGPAEGDQQLRSGDRDEPGGLCAAVYHGGDQAAFPGHPLAGPRQTLGPGAAARGQESSARTGPGTVPHSPR